MVITLDELNALVEKYHEQIRMAQAHIDVVTELISLAKSKEELCAVEPETEEEFADEETASEYQTVVQY